MTAVAFKVALGGALGGATNAALCYARLPVAVSDNPKFAWHVVPAGAVHGGLLALAAFSLGMTLSRRSLHARLAAALPLAWITGFVSWIPLNRSAFDQPWAKSMSWALHEGWGAALLGPLQHFGFVALLYYLAVALYLARERGLTAHVTLAAGAGIFGSLWWWILIGPWYFSPLHGAIWGTFVGVGAWRSRGPSFPTPEAGVGESDT